MTELAKVKRGAYQRLKPSELLIFADFVVKSILGKEDYQELAEAANILKDRVAALYKALEEAKSRDSMKVFEKNKCVKAVKEAMNDVSNFLDCYAQGSVSYIVNSGMKPRTHSNKKSTSTDFPDTPINVVVKPTTQEGCIDVTYELVNPDQVLTVAAEWSSDGGVTWNNGNYFTGGKGKMENLPSFTRVMVRFRSIGKNDKKSGWTIPITVPVL